MKLARKGLRFIRNEGAKTESQCFAFLDSFLKEKSGPTIAFLSKLYIKNMRNKQSRGTIRGLVVSNHEKCTNIKLMVHHMVSHFLNKYFCI